jgi:AcrR family transcriptional regulator
MSRSDHESAERQRILTAAAHLARREGPGFTMKKLARAAGVSRATLYRRVPSRSSLDEQLREAGLESGLSMRERILAATTRVLTKTGPEGLTLEQVAEEAGVGATTLYRTFGDRSGLLREAIAALLPRRKLASGLEDWDAPVEVTLRRFVEAALERFTKNPLMVAVLFRSNPDEMKALRRLRRAEESLSTALCAFFTEQAKRGRIAPRPPQELAASLMGLALGRVVFARMHGDSSLGTPAVMAQTATEIVEMFMNGARVSP